MAFFKHLLQIVTAAARSTSGSLNSPPKVWFSSIPTGSGSHIVTEELVPGAPSRDALKKVFVEEKRKGEVVHEVSYHWLRGFQSKVILRYQIPEIEAKEEDGGEFSDIIPNQGLMGEVRRANEKGGPVLDIFEYSWFKGKGVRIGSIDLFAPGYRVNEHIVDGSRIFLFHPLRDGARGDYCFLCQTRICWFSKFFECNVLMHVTIRFFGRKMNNHYKILVS